MFEENVYSDPCLVLTGTIQKIDNKYWFKVDQSFDYADMKKATDSRIVTIKYTSQDADSKQLFGDISIGTVWSLQSVARFISMVNFAFGASTNRIAVYGLTPDANNKWSGYIQIS